MEEFEKKDNCVNSNAEESTNEIKDDEMSSEINIEEENGTGGAEEGNRKVEESKESQKKSPFKHGKIRRAKDVKKKCYGCIFCPKKFGNEDYMREHLERHVRRTYRCPNCNAAFTRKGDFEQHQSNCCLCCF